MIQDALASEPPRHLPEPNRPALADHSTLPPEAFVGHATFDDFDALDWLRFWLPRSD
jgi:hypothetical protein